MQNTRERKQKPLVDNKNRKRSKTVGFRVSPEEWEEINRYVNLSGMNKQEYIMSRLTNREIVVMPNSRVLKALQVELREVLGELQRIERLDGGEAVLDVVRVIGEIVAQM